MNLIHSTEHLESLFKQRSNLAQDDFMTYLADEDLSIEHLSMLVNEYSNCCWFIDKWPDKFASAICLNSKEKIKIIEPLFVKNNKLLIKSLSSYTLSFDEALYYFNPHSSDSKNIAAGLALLKRNDYSLDFEVNFITLLSKEKDLYTYLSMLGNFMFKNEKSMDTLITFLCTHGFASGTRLLMLKNFSEHPQITDLHKLQLIETLWLLNHNKNFENVNELKHTYEFIKNSLTDIPESFLGKLLW